MLKKINVEQLTVGMHLKEFCGSWMEHPFWRTGFVLSDPKDIAAILGSSIKEVWIDSSKGLDAANGAPVVSEAESEARVEARLQQLADTETLATAPVPMGVELERAAKICFQSKQAVISMFQEARMGNAVDIGGAKKLVEDISDSVARNPGALISLARLKTADDYTYMHSVAVCAMMVGLAKQLDLDEGQTRSAGMAGLLHDLGKALMPMEVLNKPDKLSAAEFNVIKTHPSEGHRLLRSGLDVDPLILDVCLHHHEKTDGSGYPKGLKADEISLFAKMGAVCDVYDAITSNRPYKSGWDPAESLRKMAEWANGHFDGKVFQAFVKSLGIYPIGSLVKLTSGRLGVVVEQTGKSLTTPSVKVFFSTKSNLRIMPEVVDLSLPGATEKIVSREDPDKWRFADLNELWSGFNKAHW
ncbi:MAG: HD-GYP domain-containing protein [Pseudomonadota bacterium]